MRYIKLIIRNFIRFLYNYPKTKFLDVALAFIFATFLTFAIIDHEFFDGKVVVSGVAGFLGAAVIATSAIERLSEKFRSLLSSKPRRRPTFSGLVSAALARTRLVFGQILFFLAGAWSLAFPEDIGAFVGVLVVGGLLCWLDAALVVWRRKIGCYGDNYLEVQEAAKFVIQHSRSGGSDDFKDIFDVSHDLESQERLNGAAAGAR